SIRRRITRSTGFRGDPVKTIRQSKKVSRRRGRQALHSRPAFSVALLLLLSLPGGPTRPLVGAAEPETSTKDRQAGADLEFFEKEVRPLLVARCLSCHGDARSRSGLKLTSRASVLQGGDRGPAVVPGKPEDSLLVRAVRYEDTPRMPPKEKLTDRQIETLARWVKLGVPWPGRQPLLAPAEGL